MTNDLREEVRTRYAEAATAVISGAGAACDCCHPGKSCAEEGHAFGPERVAWGSDITRDGITHTYAEAVAYLLETDELDDAEKELLLGMSLRRLLAWEAPAVTSRGTSVSS